MIVCAIIIGRKGVLLMYNKLIKDNSNLKELQDKINKEYPNRYKVTGSFKIVKSSNPKKIFIRMVRVSDNFLWNIQLSTLKDFMSKHIDLLNRDYKKFPDRQAKIDERHNKNEFILIKYNNSVDNPATALHNSTTCGYCEFTVRYGNLIQPDRGCPICGWIRLRNERHNTKEEVQKLLDNNPNCGNYKIIKYAGNARDKSLVKCLNCGNIWKVTTGELTKSKFCPKCYVDNMDHCRLGISEVKKRIKNKFGDRFTLITTEYKDNRQKVVIRCNNCQQTFVRTLHGFIGKGSKGICPHCGASYGERSTYNILKFNNINFEYQHRITTPKFKRLYMDFYLPKDKICIEIDGIQHYDKTINWYSSTSHQRDLSKDEYCKQHGIKMIRIPFYDDYGIVTMFKLLNKNIPYDLNMPNNKLVLRYEPRNEKEIFSYLKTHSLLEAMNKFDISKLKARIVIKHFGFSTSRDLHKKVFKKDVRYVKVKSRDELKELINSELKVDNIETVANNHFLSVDELKELIK